MDSTVNSDWRLQGQEKYLRGARLRWQTYHQRSKDWDHDHCEFCWAKFAEVGHIPDALHGGYATEDHYRWICANCFADFKNSFAWMLLDE